MRRLILGIIAVVVLQAGFIAYIAYYGVADSSRVAVDHIPDQVAPSRELTSDRPESNDSGDVISNPSSDRSTRSEVSAKRPRGNAPPAWQASLVNRHGTVRRRNLQTFDLEALNRSTVITYRKFRPVPLSVKSKPEVAETLVKPGVINVNEKVTNKTEKRSLIARLQPVIKKPWNWMKAVGSLLR